MKSINNIIKLPALQQTMVAMGREMEKVRTSPTAQAELGNLSPWVVDKTDGVHRRDGFRHAGAG